MKPNPGLGTSEAPPGVVIRSSQTAIPRDCTIEMTNPGELDALMDEDAYKEYTDDL